jgi:hypothetical protein
MNYYEQIFRTEDKPWLSALNLNIALHMIRFNQTGELSPDEFVDKLKADYRMKVNYREQLEEAVKFYKAFNYESK